MIYNLMEKHSVFEKEEITCKTTRKEEVKSFDIEKFEIEEKYKLEKFRQENIMKLYREKIITFDQFQKCLFEKV